MSLMEILPTSQVKKSFNDLVFKINVDLGDKEESKTENQETAEVQEEQKVVPAPKETPIANKADELALDLEEEELDYDDELSDDGSGKRESKFKSERKVENDERIRTKRLDSPLDQV